MSTIRFRDLIKTAGTPEPKSLWTDPKEDRDFMRAVKQNRVLTVVQESARKDFGELGFHQRAGALYFVFPKSLPSGEGKVVGIKYDLVKEGEPKDRVSAKDLKRNARKKTKRVEPEKRQPETKTFNVLVRRVAVVETNVLVKAHSKMEAKQKSIEMIKNQGFDLTNAKIENKIKSVK